MKIEISSYRKFGDAIETCNDEPTRAHGVAVYLCNPMAMHLKDWPVADYVGPFGQRMRDALRDATVWAADFIDHINEPKTAINVRFSLPGIVPATGPAEIPLSELLDSAACLWEAALTFMETPDSETGKILDAERLKDGTCSLRYAVTAWAEECHKEYEATGGAEAGVSFDWEWCPDWLAKKVASSFPAVDS